MTERPAGYCPECGHLLGNDDVVRIIGRHPDGVEPSFRCPACDGEVSHPSRAPEDAPTYEGRARRRDRPEDAFEEVERTVVAAGSPPIDLGDLAVGDRITLHYRDPDLVALGTTVGTVRDLERGPGGSPTAVEIEADTGRTYRFEPGGRGDLFAEGERAGRIVRLEARR